MYNTSDISVVIPSYNNLDYLKLIHSSVRAISDKVELILYDDGSTDGTKEWLTSLNEPNTITHILSDRDWRVNKF